MAALLLSPTVAKSMPEFVHALTPGYSPHSSRLKKRGVPLCCISDKFLAISPMKTIPSDDEKEIIDLQQFEITTYYFSFILVPPPGI
jgi:hypothetical protein